MSSNSVLVNLDTGTAFAFVSENTSVRSQLEAFVINKQLVITQSAYNEFIDIVNIFSGSKEQTNAAIFLKRLILIPDDPSSRAKGLTITNSVGANDIIIFGTGDKLGITTMTADAKFVRGARAQGIDFDVYEHAPVPLTGR